MQKRQHGIIKVHIANQYGGIPSSDLDSSVQASLGKADTAIQSLTAGTNVQISGTTISATDTTYSNFVGTDGNTGGTAGLVPAPTTSDTDKYLKSDGTWATVSGGGGTSDYTDLTNKPSINSVTLSGNKTSADLGIPSITVSTTDLTPGTSPLADGTFYFVYE